MGSFIMKIKTKSGITEELDFERIVNQLQQMALEKDYYFTELDINYLIKNIKNEIDNFVSGFSYSDTVVPYVDFVNNATSIAVGDDRFVIYRGNQKPTSEFELPLTEEVESVFHGDKYTGLVFLEGSSEAKYRIDVYSESGSLVFSKKFDMEYTDIVLHGDLIIIYNSSECSIYNIRGTEKFGGTFDKSVLTLIPTDSMTKFILISGNRAEEIRLK